MISGAPRSRRRLRRLFRLMTRRYRSLRSEVAKRPPSSWTIGRSSGGITGTTSRIMARGSLTRRPWSSRRLKAATIFRRLMAFCLRWADRGLLALRRVERRAELDLLLVEVDAVDELLDGVGAHAALEVLAVAVLELAPQHLVLDDLAGEQVLELVEGPLEEVELARRSARGRRPGPSRRPCWRALMSESLAPSFSSSAISSSSSSERRASSSSRCFSISSRSASISASRFGRSSWRRSSSTQVTRLAAK